MSVSAPAPRQPREAVVLFGCCLCLTLLFAAICLTNLREPWSDEAMLAYNFIGPALEVTLPLPYYEQAAPIGYVVIVEAVTQSLGVIDTLTAMRLVSLVAFSVGLILTVLWFVRERSWIAITVLFAIVFSSGWIWQYAVEIKHYSFEFLATAAILASARWLTLQGSLTSGLCFLLTCILAPALSFTSPLVVIATIAAVLTYHFIARPPQAMAGSSYNTRDKGFWWLVLVSGLATIAVLGFHLLVNRGLVHYQMTAYSGFYTDGLINLHGSMIENVKILSRLPEYLLQPLGQGAVRALLVRNLPDGFALYALISLGSLAVLLVIMALAIRRAAFLVLMLAYVMVLAMLLNGLGMLPFSSPRHFFFLTPVILILTGFAAIEIAGFAAARITPAWLRLMSIATAVLLIATSALGAYHTYTQRSPELLPVLAEIAARDPDATVWLYPSVQPATLMFAPEQLTLLGLIDNRSSEVAWTDRFGPETAGTPEYSMSALEADGPLWLIFPIVEGLDQQDHIDFFDSTGRECTLHLETNGTRLVQCRVLSD